MTYSSELRTGYGPGRTGEKVSIWRGAKASRGIPLICCHGFLGSATQAYDSPSTPSTGIGRAAGERDVTCLWPDLGLGDDGLNNWGHDDTVDPGGAIDDAITFAGTLGCRTDQVGIYGTSMGGTAMAWCWRNPTRLAAAAFTIPCVATAALHTRNPIGLADYLDLAFVGEGGFWGSVATHDPSHPANVAQIIPMAARIHLWYSADDNVIDAADVESFAAATGVGATNVGPVGHSLAFDQGQVFDWLFPRLTGLDATPLTIDGDLTVTGSLTRAA